MVRRIFVVDDELPVLEGVQHIVSTAFPDGEVSGIARTGMQALEILHDDPPDILLVDIHLPGISGLEVVSSIRRRHPDVLCIIISAYEQFSIAKEALDHGVYAYIVKPVTKPRLLQVLRAACEELDRSERLQATDLAGKALLRSINGLLEQQLIPRLFSGMWYPQNEQWEQWVTALKSVRPDFFPTVAAATLSARNADDDRLAAGLRYKLPCWAVALEQGGVGVLVAGTCPDPELSLRQALRETIQLTTKGIANSSDLQLLCSDRIPVERVWEVLPAVRRQFIGGLDDESAVVELRHGLQRLAAAVRSADVSRLESCRNKIIPLLNQVLIWNRDMADIVLLEPLYDAYPPPQSIPVQALLLASLEGAHELINGLVDLLQRASRLPDGNAPVGRSLHAALAYVRAHHYEQISLEDAAAEAGVSAAHLSRLFRRELQLSFSDYLTSLRMERARALLESGISSVKETSYRTGYQDANYFSRVFKRWVGMSPREYAAKQPTHTARLPGDREDKE